MHTQAVAKYIDNNTTVTVGTRRVPNSKNSSEQSIKNSNKKTARVLATRAYMGDMDMSTRRGFLD